MSAAMSSSNTPTYASYVTPIKRRKSYRNARAFYLVLLVGVLFAVCAYRTQSAAEVNLESSLDGNLNSRNTPNTHQLLPRTLAVETKLNEDEECRLVHRSKDQCAFVKKHCPDDEAGFTTYLNLYFCKLPNAKPVAFIILISWLGLLFSTIGIAASDFFCINLSTIADLLGMSESMAGVTLLAFGNGSPDVFSTFSAMSTNSGSLAVGELMGAAGFITAVVAGAMALIKPFHVARKSFVRDVSFFLIAASFSLYFIYDGRLNLWECITMVVYYIVYVAFVVAWHWWIGRRRRRRERMAAARGHFLPPGDEMDLEQEYHDDPDESTSRPTLSRGASRDDFAALEQGGSMPYGEAGDEDEEEEARDRWMSELNSNMRLARPRTTSRRNTIGPVRPSLVGALEFQAVLSSLQKSQNIQTIPLDSRRYSDDPTYTTAQQQDTMSATSDPAARPPYQIVVNPDASPSITVERPGLDVPKSAPARSRAVSANDAFNLHIDPDLRRPNQQQDDNGDLIDFSERSRSNSHTSHTSSHLEVPGQSQHSMPQTPTVEISSPPTEHEGQAETFNLDSFGRRSPDHLAASDANAAVMRRDDEHFTPRYLRHNESPHESPRTVPQARSLPKIVIPRERRSRDSTPASTPFPAYHDNMSATSTRPPSLYLPPPIASPESIPVSQFAEQPVYARPIRWWPYKVLPPPGVLISTLFPTIYHWHEKSIWEKMIGIVAAPSVLLLTITLPVVESDKDNDDDNRPVTQPTSYDSARHRSIGGVLDGVTDGLKRSAGPEPYTPGSHIHRSSLSLGGATGMGNAASLAAATEQHNRNNYGNHATNLPTIAIGQEGFITSPSIMPANASPPNFPTTAAEKTEEPWNRWLAILQLFTSPLFCILAVFNQQDSTTSTRWLLLPCLISLLCSTILLIPFLLTTTPTHRPQPVRILASFAGFIVSIAWISSIADQVVGALKALAVICNMSHAIMGLTIFAVGNSLGDLVADVTVARLGYPVMALSACFGGPMLNILLGIGLSGTYILIRGAEHRHYKHPDQGLHFKVYHIDVGRTLIVSGITLVVTLVGLLVAVPMNKWVLDRKIGWCLIALWTVSTVGNVVLEVSGWGVVGSEG